jgi:outer membrane biogenesis lipoprotein LolB
MWSWRRKREASGRQGSMLEQRARKIHRMVITMGGAHCMHTVEPYPPLLPCRGENSRTTRLAHFASLCIAMVMLAGCTLMTPQDELTLTQVTAQELTALLQQREAAVQSLKGLFSAKVRGGLIPIASRVEGTVYFRRPNTLRLKGFTPFGQELFEFIQAEDRYKLRLPLEGRTYAGHQSEMKALGKLARFSQLSVWAVGGVLGRNAIAKDEMVKVAEERGRYRLDVYAPVTGGTSPSRPPIRRLWFDRRLLVVQEEWLGSSGEIEATIQYDDFRPLEESGSLPAQAVGEQDVRLFRPFKVSLEDGRGQGTVHITFHEIHHNQALRAEDLGQIS